MYYPHIDGIRALAVLPVMLFHVLASLCPGGFAGVDVFFVISGYLITGGILRDLAKGRFTIRDFYHRRIRRIMPANVVLIASVFAVGCAMYYCVPLRNLGDASVMSTLFSANYYSWRLGGDYFAPDVHQNPLLHLWTLSVEEQFYLFIPLLCAIIWRVRRRWVAPILLTMAGLSFATAVHAMATGARNSAFYLLEYRAWELLAGSLLAMLPALPEGQATGRGRHALLAAAGLLMVLLPYALLSSRTPFPGLAALPSVAGTALLIRYGQTRWIGSLLSCGPAVAIGKISYSLYLWHWPITVFWRYAVYDQLGMGDYAGMLALSLLLGYLSWRFVEMPVRTSPAWTTRRSFAFAAAGIVLLVSIGMACVLGKGWPTILHPKANELIAEINVQQPSFVEARIRGAKRLLGWSTPAGDDNYDFAFGNNGTYRLGASGEADVLLVGDSHAGSLRYGLDRALRDSHRGGWAISQASADMFNLSDSRCQEALAELSKHPSVSKVILVEYWSTTVPGRDRSSDSHIHFKQLEEFAVHIRQMNKTLFVVTDVPILNRSRLHDMPARLAIITPRAMESGWDGVQSDAQYSREQGDINARLEAVCAKTGAVFVPMHLAFKQGNCFSAVEARDGRSVPLYRDEHHLSPEGSLRAARFMMPYIFPEPRASTQ